MQVRVWPRENKILLKTELPDLDKDKVFSVMAMWKKYNPLCRTQKKCTYGLLISEISAKHKIHLINRAAFRLRQHNSTQYELRVSVRRSKEKKRVKLSL